MSSLLELKDISMNFYKKGKLFEKEKEIKVLRNVNLQVEESEIMVIVGESGCGKTTIGKIITGLLKPSKGELLFNGKNIYKLFNTDQNNFRNSVQFIQQDSYAALNPARTIYQSLSAPIKTKHKKMSDKEVKERINEIMGLVGLTPADQFLYKFPHQLSGGQRQRILMARAITLDPKLIVADEPVSMIDVSLRLSILNLMSELNRKLKISFVYITHDLATAKYIAHNGRICVMYLGEIMETGNVQDLINNPSHPYTQALFAAVPIPDPIIARRQKELPIKSMDVGDLLNRNDGCPFYPRCPYAEDKCKDNIVDFADVNNVKVKCCNLEKVPKWEIIK